MTRQCGDWERFLATELGALWWTYHNAMIDFWSADEMTPAQLERLNAALEQASEPFRAKLMEIAGIPLARKSSRMA
jgi:hypothetical protein